MTSTIHYRSTRSKHRTAASPGRCAVTRSKMYRNYNGYSAMVPCSPGQLIKLGPNHDKVVHSLVVHRGGRHAGKREPVPKHLQEKGMNYCGTCNRLLNANNTLGRCQYCLKDGKGASV